MANAKNGQRHPPKKQHDAFDWITLFATVAGVIILCGYTRITAYQASISKDTETRQLRAYLSGFGGNFIYGVEDEKWGARIDVYNAGQTPARRICVKAIAKILKYPRPDSSIFDEYPVTSKDCIPKNGFVLAAQQHHDFSVTPDPPAPISFDDLKNILTDKTRRPFAFGIIYYEDVFGNQWATTFCRSFWYNTGVPLVAEPGRYIPNSITAEDCPRDNGAK